MATSKKKRRFSKKNEKVKKPLCPQRHYILFAAFSGDFGCRWKIILFYIKYIL